MLIAETDIRDQPAFTLKNSPVFICYLRKSLFMRKNNLTCNIFLFVYILYIFTQHYATFSRRNIFFFNILISSKTLMSISIISFHLHRVPPEIASRFDFFSNRAMLFQIGKGPDWEQQREKEEKLVADIIDRVKRECEAQGETVTRRGYSRRSTIMNS